MVPALENEQYIWATSFYWIFEVIATAGYREFSYGTNAEYIFAILLEFIGVTFNSILVANLSGIFDGELKFEDLLTEKMDQLLVWMKKIEFSNKYVETEETDKSLDPFLYSEIARFVEDAFLGDFNLIVEEFQMY